MESKHSRDELMVKLRLSHRAYFRTQYLNKAIELGLVEPTIPDKPTSSKQKYRLTPLGKKLKQQLKNA
jgi:DNA-binding HxlR family transcriptional regulator